MKRTPDFLADPELMALLRRGWEAFGEAWVDDAIARASQAFMRKNVAANDPEVSLATELVRELRRALRPQ